MSKSAYTPGLVRGAILALLAKNEGRVLDADEIGSSLRGCVSRKVIYRTLNELQDRGCVERLWFCHMQHPRFGIDEAFEQEVVRPMLLSIIEDAGVKGITQTEAEGQLISRLMDFGQSMPFRGRR